MAPTARGPGRPPKFATPEALEEAVAGYFDRCAERGLAPTMAELAIECGYSSESGFYAQTDRVGGEEFLEVLQRTKLRLQAWHERRLSGTTPTGSIFWLKTYAGKKETSGLEVSGPGGAPIQARILRIPNGREAS